MKTIPGRVLRLGQRFDFIAALGERLSETELEAFTRLMKDEAAASVTLSDVLFGSTKPTLFRKSLIIQ
jgi:hypothetical protein